MSTRKERAIKYYKKNGFAKTCKKSCRVVKNILMQKRVWKYYMATEEELANNKRSHSAKLRVAEKI